MTAVGLIHRNLTSDHYQDEVAADPQIDDLRDKMEVVENPDYSVNYLNPEKQSIGNAIQVLFNDGTQTECIEVECPIGHHRRRSEGIPKLIEKYKEMSGHDTLAKEPRKSFHGLTMSN